MTRYVSAVVGFLHLAVMATALSPANAFSLEYKKTYDPSWDYATKQKERCSDGNMMQMNMCLEFEFNKADKQLNAVYKKLLNALKEPESLVHAQRAWLKFRNLQCEFEVPSSREGSAVPYSRNACLIDLTVKRILDLKQIFPCNGCVEFKKEYYGY